jgi:hypothetical protein
MKMQVKGSEERRGETVGKKESWGIDEKDKVRNMEALRMTLFRRYQ